MIYNFICTLKGIDFKYKVESDSLLEAKVKIREHIKNSVEIEEYIKEPINQNSKEFIDFFNDILNGKTK